MFNSFLFFFFYSWECFCLAVQLANVLLFSPHHLHTPPSPFFFTLLLLGFGLLCVCIQRGQKRWAEHYVERVLPLIIHLPQSF